ncbi:MAG: hypothetical protein ABIV26_04090 [Candidatus Limnocylindrales bacterium]
MNGNALVDWQEFFTYVGLVAGGLTGLIFVALSLHVASARARPAYIQRARTTLGALTGFLVICGLALVPGQSASSFGITTLVVLAVLIGDVLRHLRGFGVVSLRRDRPLLVRTSAALVLFFIGALGCLGLVVGAPWSMTAVGLSTLLGLPVRIIQAWALLEAAMPLQPPAP